MSDRYLLCRMLPYTYEYWIYATILRLCYYRSSEDENHSSVNGHGSTRTCTNLPHIAHDDLPRVTDEKKEKSARCEKDLVSSNAVCLLHKTCCSVRRSLTNTLFSRKTDRRVVTSRFSNFHDSKELYIVRKYFFSFLALRPNEFYSDRSVTIHPSLTIQPRFMNRESQN